MRCRYPLAGFHMISVGQEGFSFCVKAVGFIYLMSTNLFISKKNHLREIIEEFLLLFFSS